MVYHTIGSTLPFLVTVPGIGNGWSEERSSWMMSSSGASVKIYAMKRHGENTTCVSKARVDLRTWQIHHN
jgi:hypothetical protein